MEEGDKGIEYLQPWLLNIQVLRERERGGGGGRGGERERERERERGGGGRKGGREREKGETAIRFILSSHISCSS